MEKRDKIYEGKAKILYTTDDKDLVIQYFKDDATAFNAKKKGTVDEKITKSLRDKLSIASQITQDNAKEWL